MKYKSGQMKIQQMAFMLIAVMIFFALVGLLIVAVKFSGLKEKATDLEEDNARLLVAKLANSPEFSCGDSFGGSRVSCIDSDKVMILKGRIDNYRDFWDVSNIEIIKLYPAEDQEIECILGQTYPDCNTIKLISGELKGIYTGNFVSLCRKEFDGQITYDKCELAKILISYEKVK